MEPVYGHTTLTCRRCGTITAIENRTLEKVTEHRCHGCGFHMTDREIAHLKMHLYLLWTQIYNDHWGPIEWNFDYDIDLHPYYKAKESEENGNREEG